MIDPIDSPLISKLPVLSILMVPAPILPRVKITTRFTRCLLKKAILEDRVPASHQQVYYH